jgi:hypothetical protein
VAFRRDIGDVVAEALMTRAAVSDPIILVEGGNDASFWRGRFIASSQIIVCGGKTTAEGALQELDRAKFPKVVAVVDDDLDYVLGIEKGSLNLVKTSKSDLETMLLSSEAFEKLLNDLTTAEKIAEVERRIGVTLRDGLIARCLIFGKLRYVDRLYGTNVAFDDIPPYKYIDPATWNLDEARLISDFARLSKRAEAQIRDDLDDMPEIDPWRLIRGHDAMAALWILNAQVLRGPNLKKDHLCMLLRVAYEGDWIRATSTYADIRHWEKRAGIKVLR